MKVNIMNLEKMAASPLSYADKQTFFFKVPVQNVFPESANEPADFWQDGEITVEGAVINKGQTLEVSGIIESCVNCQCNLCLEDTCVKMRVPFCQEYQEATPGKSIDNASDEDEISYFAGNEINLLPLVQQTLFLAQPLRQACREDCRGLCPECGTNLNITDCGCANEKIDARMSVLEKLLVKKNGKDS